MSTHTTHMISKTKIVSKKPTEILVFIDLYVCNVCNKWKTFFEIPFFSLNFVFFLLLGLQLHYDSTSAAKR